MHVAFLGLGIMGSGMAANLVKAGNQVTTWTRSGKTVAGATAAKAARDAVAGAEVVWICVSDTEAVRDVLFGKEGIESSLKAGMVVADSSTISPFASQEFAQRLAAKSVKFVDVPVTGSKTGAETGQLIFIAGGDSATLERLQPLFQAMGKKVVHVGEQGKGLSAKLAMNLNIGLIYEGLAEGMVLARKLGVDPKVLSDLIMASMLKSGVAEYKLPAILSRDFSANFPLRLMLKDMRLMLDSAKQAKVELPALMKVAEIYQESAAAGLSDEDYAATIVTLEKRAGLS